METIPEKISSLKRRINESRRLENRADRMSEKYFKERLRMQKTLDKYEAQNRQPMKTAEEIRNEFEDTANEGYYRFPDNGRFNPNYALWLEQKLLSQSVQPTDNEKKVTLDDVKEYILNYTADSDYKQAAIVMMRGFFEHINDSNEQEKKQS